MPKSASQNAMIKEKRKNQIMETALKLFANYGIDNVTVDNISQSMKISHGLFYHYFEDKEDLVGALITRAKDMFTANLQIITQEDKEPANLIRKLTASALENIEHSEVQAYYLYLVLCLDFQSEQPGRDFTNHFRNSLLKLFRDGKASGDFKDINEEDLLTIYLCSLQGVAYHRIKFKKTYHIPSTDSLVQLLLK